MSDGKVIIDTEINQTGAINDMNSLNIKLTKVAKSIAKVFSVVALAKFGKEAVSLASDIQEVQNVVDTAFGDMSYKMEEFADTAIETYGISKLTAKQTASSYMAMAKGLGLASEDASNMALQLTALSADMASFYNVSQDVANVALKSIFTGETETLKRYGIVMTEANLQTFAMSQGITKSMKDMSQAEKTQLRYMYVMNQTKMAQGDFAKTSDSWANQTRILNERWKEFMSTVGTTLMTILTPAVKMLNNLASSLITIANTFNKALGIKTVSQSVDSVTDSVEEYEEAVVSATKSTNKMLGAYDNLQVVSSNDDSSDTSVFGGITDSVIKETASNANEYSSYMQGMADRIKSIFEKLDLEKIAKMASNANDAFKKLAETLFTKFFERMAKISIDVINRVVDVLNGLFEIILKIPASTLESWGEALAIVVTSIVIFKTLTGVVGTISRVSTALSAFLGVLTAHPLLAIATGVATLAIAIANFFEPDYETSNSIFPQLTGEISDFKKEIEELLDEISGARDTRKQAIEDIDDTYDGIKGLVDKYYALKEVQEPTNEQLAEMQTIYEQLIKDVPAFKKILDDTNSSYDEQKKAIDDTITSLKQKAKAEASYEFLIEAEKEKIKADKALIKSENEYGKNAENLYKEWVRITDLKKAKEEEYLKALAESQTLGTKASKEKAEQLKKEYDELVQWQINASANYKTVKAEQDALTNASKQASTDITYYSGIISGEISGSAEDYKNYVEYVEVQNEKLVNNMQKTSEELKKKNIGNAINDLFSKLNPTITVDEIVFSDKVKETLKSLSKTPIGAGVSGLLTKIPFLASGAVLPANKPFMAMVGDQAHGTNIEAPLDTIKQALSEVMEGQSNGDIVIEIDGREVFRAVRNQDTQYKNMTGTSAFV